MGIKDPTAVIISPLSNISFWIAEDESVVQPIFMKDFIIRTS